MTLSIDGFRYQRVPVGDGVGLHTAWGGTGTPVVLLHGFPQTHLMWRHVATALAADHTVICPDLRGYGDSDKPAEAGPGSYAKRTMADEIVAPGAARGEHRGGAARARPGRAGRQPGRARPARPGQPPGRAGRPDARRHVGHPARRRRGG